MSVALTGKDVVQIDNYILRNLADGDAVKIDYTEDLGQVKVGKGGNAIFGLNESGAKADVSVRVLLGSADDKYLNARLQEYRNDPSAFILLTCNFTKRTGDGTGKVTPKTYQGANGIFKKIPGGTSNSDGATDQSVVEYIMTYADMSPRL